MFRRLRAAVFWTIACSASLANCGRPEGTASEPTPSTEVPERSPGVERVAAPESLLPVAAELERQVADGEIRSLSVLVLLDGEVVWDRGFGWTAANLEREVSTDTIYPIASVSKYFTGMAAAILMAEGRLSLTASVDEQLRSFDVARGSWVEGDLRVGDLLRMNAGIPHGSIAWLRDFPPPRSASCDVVRSFAALDETPGEMIRYSNYTYGVLECLIGDVSGAPFAEFLNGRIFEPLGMTSTSAQPNLAEFDRFASIHAGSYVFDQPPFLVPTGGLGFYSTVADLAKLVRVMIDPEYATGQGIPTDVLDLLRDDPEEDTTRPGYWMGLARFGDEDARFEIANGQVYDSTSAIITHPRSGAAAIVLTNTRHAPASDDQRLADKTAMQIMDSIVGGCTEALQIVEEEFERSQASLAQGEDDAQALLSVGLWSGVLILDGDEIDVAFNLAEDGSAELRFEGVTASSEAAQYLDKHLTIHFSIEGERFRFHGDEAGLTSLSLRMVQRAPDRLVGSVVLSAQDETTRTTIGSGAGLIDLHR